MERAPLERSQCGTHLGTFPELHIAAPMADYLRLSAPPLHECSIAWVSVEKHDVTGKRGTFYLQARKTKGLPSFTGDPVVLSRNWA